MPFLFFVFSSPFCALSSISGFLLYLGSCRVYSIGRKTKNH